MGRDRFRRTRPNVGAHGSFGGATHRSALLPWGLQKALQSAMAASETLTGKPTVSPRVSDRCPRCLRTGSQRRMFPDGTCVSRVACDKERALAIYEGLIKRTPEDKEDQTMSITDIRQIPAATLVNMPIKEIVNKGGIALTDAYKIRKEAAAELNSEGASESLKTQVLAVVTKHGQQPDLLSIQEQLDNHPPMQDISRAVWALQKQGELTFYERKKGRDSILTQIKLPKGHSSMVHKTGSGPVKAVGRDMTEARHQPAIAPGGPIEHIPARAEPIKQKTIQGPTYTLVTPAVVTKPSLGPLPQNEKPAPPVVVEPKKPTYDVDGAVWLTRLEKDSPLIFALLERAEKRSSYETAAKALEGIDDEMALELLSKVSLTPLEDEVVRYARRSTSNS